MKRYAFPLSAPVCPPTVSAHAQQKAVTIGVVNNPDQWKNLPSDYDLADVFKSVRMGFQVIA
jgi:hypothetical protein